jgi:hypothetical protein
VAVWSLTPTTSIAYNDDDGCQRHPDRNYFSSVTLQQRIGRPQGMIQQQSGSIRNAHTSCTHDSHASPVRQRHRMPAAAPRLPDRAKQALVHSHIVLFCPCDPMCVRACVPLDFIHAIGFVCARVCAAHARVRSADEDDDSEVLAPTLRS